VNGVSVNWLKIGVNTVSAPIEAVPATL